MVVVKSQRVVIPEKHASELDLQCESYDDGVDWRQVRQQLFAFLRTPAEAGFGTVQGQVLVA